MLTVIFDNGRKQYPFYQKNDLLHTGLKFEIFDTSYKRCRFYQKKLTY